MTIPQDSGNRPLSYPLNRSLEYSPFSTPQGENVTYLDLSQWITQDSTERVRLVFDWSLEEFIAIATSIDVGSDIAYNQNSGYIWWVWVRGLISMSLCDDVADCIDNSSAVATAIANLISNNPVVLQALQQALDTLTVNNYGADTPLPDAVLQQDILPSGALCTDQNRYAMALTAVRAMDTLATDFLQIIEVLTNPNEIASEIASSIPVFGDGLALTLDTANWLQDNITENYSAAYNPTSEEKIACEIYCIMDGNCDLSFNQLLQAYENIGTITPPQSNNFAAVMAWLVANITPSLDEIIVSAMHAFVLYVVKWSNDWLGVNVFNYIKQEMYNAKDEQIPVPTSCNCNDYDWCYTFNFAMSNGAFQLFPVSAGTAALWQVGNGWEARNHRIDLAYYYAARIYRDFALTEITAIDMVYDLTKGNSDNPSVPCIAIRDWTNNVVTDLTMIDFQTAVSGANQTMSWSGSVIMDSLYLLALSSRQDSAVYSGSATIKSVTLYGKGTNPFGVDNC